jgi:O-antigen ligase
VLNRHIAMGLASVGGLAAVVISTSLFDPFAAAKSFAIVTGAFALFGYSLMDILQNRSTLFRGHYRFFLVLISLFIGLFLIRAFITSDINGALYGVVGRSSGFLTYFGYALIFVLSMIYLNLNNFKYLIRALLIAGFFGSFYSLLEKFKVNPWKMSNIYNGTSSLFGNPNFSGAFLSLVVILCIWILTNKFSANVKWLAVVTLPLAIYGVYTSKALQGIISIAIGLLILVLIRFFQRKKQFGLVGLISAAVIGFIGLLGSLNIGPLSSILYKGSVAERGDMWRTAISMIRKHPVWGVGIERYGAYFRQYRDLKQTLRAGPDVFSDNAHNVVLHLMATGGIFLGALYLVIVISIFVVGIKALISASQEKKSLLGLSLALWIPIQAQNTISVDNPAVFVWSWILGGAIIAIAAHDETQQTPKSNKQSSKVSTNRSSTTHALAPVVTLLFILLSLSLTLKPIIAQKSFQFAFYLSVDPKQPDTLKNKVAALEAAENQDPGNVTWPRYSANSLFIDQAWPETVSAAQRALDKDPSDWVSWWFMASAYEKAGDFAKAIPARLKTIELDPLNTAVLLELAKDQKAVGDLAGLAATKAKVLAINPNAPEIPALNSL